MKTPEQLKGAIRNIAAQKNLRPQEVLQMFLFERLLERLAVSRYRNNFILKGGLLISSMIGIDERTTIDMDTTVRGISMEETEITSVILEILSLDVDDGITFAFRRIEAEKYETILRRNIGTTRARDFYDLHTLYRERNEEIRADVLRLAVAHTARKRGSAAELADWKEIVQDIREEPTLTSLWNNYAAENPYIGKLQFSEVVDTVECVGRLLQE